MDGPTLTNSQPKRFRLARNAKLAQIFNRTRIIRGMAVAPRDEARLYSTREE